MPGGRGKEGIINTKAMKWEECSMFVLGIDKSYYDYESEWVK